MAGLTVDIKNMDLFREIIALIKKYGENNTEMMAELTEIMNKYSGDSEYSSKSNCQSQ